MNTLTRYWPVLCVLPYLGFWLYGLTDLDEGFYGAVTIDMLRRGDWITPTLNGVPWFEKPILSYWLAMPTVALLPNEFGARLPSFLCTMATAGLIFFFVRKIFDKDRAIIATLSFSGSLLVVAIGRMMMTDGPLNLCLTAAFITFYLSIREPAPRWRLLTALCLGLAVLAKGPVALVLFIGIAALSYALLPEFRPNFRGGWLLGTLILFGVVATWYVPAYLANGDYFIDKFLIEQNIGRFRGGDLAHRVPVWAHPIYYPLVLVLAALPFAGSFFRGSFWQGIRSTPERTYLLIWLAVVVGFFTISGTKLVHYVLPAVPPLSILIGHELIAVRKIPLNNLLAKSAAWSGFLLLFANFAFIRYWQEQFRDPQSLAIQARREGRTLYVLDLGRSAETDPEIKLQLDDSSHPSLGFYYRQPIREQLDDPVQTPALVVTRGEAPAQISNRATRQVQVGKYTAAFID